MVEIKKIIAGFIILLITAATIYLIVLGSGTGVLAREATGCAISEADQKYWIATGNAAENNISCTKEQYYDYTGDPDTGSTDTLFLAIYEQNRLLPSRQKLVKIKKFRDNWDDSIHMRMIPGITYYRLVEETLEKADDEHAVFARLYECYYKDGSQMMLAVESVVIPYFRDIGPAKEWILKNKKEALKLRSLTIIDNKVMENWNKQGYKPLVEYSEESPEGLTYEGIQTIFNKKLIDNLDKETDETIKYVYGLSPQNIAIDRIYHDNFTGEYAEELLVIFKLKGTPHAGGLDCSVVAIYDKKTLNIITQKTFQYDECQFDILNDNAGRGYLVFSGSTTYQGRSSFTLQVYKAVKDLEPVLQQDNGIYSNDDRYKFSLLNNGIVRVAVPVFKTDGSGDPPEWKTKYFLKWDPVTQNLIDFVPSDFDFYKSNNFTDGTSVSPDGSYAAIPHEWEFDGSSSYVLLYDVKQNKLIKQYDLLAKYFGFTWSPDSKKVGITRLARIWVDVSVLNVETGKLIENINAYELFENQGVTFDYELDSNRPDPAYTLLEWSPDSNRLLMFYQWTDTKGLRQNGTFLYDINNQKVSEIIQNKPDSEGGNLEPKKPDGFAW